MTLSDIMISGEWIIAFVVAVIGAGGGIYLKARKDGERAGERREVTVKPPLPDIEVSKKFSPPTYHQHMALERRVGALEADTKEHREYVESQLREIRHENSDQFIKLMTAGEIRKDAITESMNQMVRAFHSRVDQLIDGHRQTTPAPKKS